MSERPYPKTNFVAFGGPTNIRPLDFEEIRRGVRAAECARLESVCSESYLGFESRPLRQIKQGEKNKQLEIAKKMKEERMSIEKIEKITGLSIEEIENL